MTRLQTSRAHEALGRDLFDPVAPARFPRAILRYRNRDWAARVGLDTLNETDWISHFAGFAPLPGSFESPLALRYHGHQFQSYNPELGDGRGFLFAQLHDDAGRLLDLGTKGSGTTPYSRGGDGRLTLKGGVREVLATAMLEALGVATSKSFSLIETGEELYRNDEPSPARSAVLVRLSHSHIRIGTFQRLAYSEDRETMARLIAHCVTHYYPDLEPLPAPDRVPAFLGTVAEAVAGSGAQMIAAGFVHGVLNSDNINITGEIFDFGPWRFLPRYDPHFTAAYFDQTGLYAFGRQPDALAWNLTRLAEALLVLARPEALEPELNRFWPAFQRELARAVLARLGLSPKGLDEGSHEGADADRAFLSAFFAFMDAEKPDYEQVFFDWRGGTRHAAKARSGPLASSYRTERFAELERLMADYAPSSPDPRAHPYFEGERPRTMLIDEMEAIWDPIAQEDDWTGFETGLAEIARMRQAYGNDPV